MAFAFEKLLVYQKSIDFAEAVCVATRRFPRGYFSLADQLNRAALSIAANLAEGNLTTGDRRNFFGIARGSVRECVPLLEIAQRREVSPPTRTSGCGANSKRSRAWSRGSLGGRIVDRVDSSASPGCEGSDSPPAGDPATAPGQWFMGAGQSRPGCADRQRQGQARPDAEERVSAESADSMSQICEHVPLWTTGVNRRM